MLLNIIPWTRLQKTTFWNSVALRYTEPAGRDYHNMGHVIRLYGYAKKLKIPYDVNLDIAILIHDMVYDSSPNKEIRSTYEFVQMINKANGLSKAIKDVDFIEGIKFSPNKVIDLVNTTINHSPQTAQDAGIPLEMIMLDLYGLAQNTKFSDQKAIFNECVNLYDNVQQSEITVNMKENLRRILGNIMVYVSKNENGAYVSEFIEIGNGIQEILINVDK